MGSDGKRTEEKEEKKVKEVKTRGGREEKG